MKAIASAADDVPTRIITGDTPTDLTDRHNTDRSSQHMSHLLNGRRR